MVQWTRSCVIGYSTAEHIGIEVTTWLGCSGEACGGRRRWGPV
jgi:hypothetical protein